MNQYLVRAEKTNKVIGGIKGNVFTKNVKGSKHLFKKIPSWGLDKEILDGLEQLGVIEIRIHDKDTAKTYISTVENFKAKSFEYDFGYGLQKFLQLDYFEVIGG